MKKIINTDRAPAPVGPYNQAVKCGNLLFSSRQILIDPLSGKILDDDIETQNRRVLDNLKAVLKATENIAEQTS